MNFPRVPPEFVGGVSVLPELFAALCRQRGQARSEAERIAKLLPDAIRSGPCFLDRLTGAWRYDFGDPFVDLPGGGVVTGTHMFHEVDRLFDILACASQRLPPAELAAYLHNLGIPGKHEDALVEFAPILRLRPSASADREVAGHGEGNSTVDWVIRDGEGPPILIDVKNRTKDLLASFAQLHAGERGPDGKAAAPLHDHALLFRSVAHKFLPRSPSEAVQAVWIKSGLRQEESELRKAFGELDEGRVHLAVLGDWDEDVYILANDERAKHRTVEVLQVRESRRYVFSRDGG